MVWQIDPQHGLGELQFFMSPAQVLNVLGPIRNSDRHYGGKLTEYRGIDVPVCNYSDDGLRAIETHWLCAPLIFQGIDLYSVKPLDLLIFLEHENKGALEMYGSVYFLEIGISASNYLDENLSVREILDEDDDERGIGIFRPNTYSSFDGDLKEIGFL